jgi:hypothetical protein
MSSDEIAIVQRHGGKHDESSHPTEHGDPGLLLILRAADFAAVKHRDQRRKDAGASPHINHPGIGACPGRGRRNR